MRKTLVCLDETTKQMIAETRDPLPAAPGRKVRHDYEYEHKGVASLFMMFAPLGGWQALRQGHRLPRRHRLCPRRQGTVRHPFP
jgi:hypothetical protein